MLKLEGRIKDISINDLVEYMSKSDKMGLLDFFSIAKSRIDNLKKSGKKGNATIIELSVQQVKQYNGSETLPFVNMSATWLKGFESWYLMKGSQNSAAIHLRNIRSIFNIAVYVYNLSPEYYPFRKFKIKTVQTIHRDLNMSEIARIKAYDGVNSFDTVAIDLWLLSFYLCGINFIDLLQAKNDQVKKGRLIYNRAKTRTIYSIKIEPEAQEIIDKYKGKVYLLRFLEQKVIVQEKKERKTPLYKDITDRTNRTLKKIAEQINKEKQLIEPELSTYYARHSWGTIASSLGTPHDVIREALGHTRTVTDIYIKFYLHRIDEANRAIIDAVKSYQLVE